MAKPTTYIAEVDGHEVEVVAYDVYSAYDFLSHTYGIGHTISMPREVSR